MSKPHTFPILFDEVKTVSISFLNIHGYLKTNQLKFGSVHWSRNGEKIGSISIKVCTYSENSFIEFDYKCNEQPVRYRVQLVSALSNLGKGFVWYFICPRTGMRCRKLYLVDTYFYHRSAFKGCMYEKQTQSKKSRYLDKTLGAYFETDQLYEQIYKKNFKKQYAGKPTKKYLKLTQQIQKAESITYHEIERIIINC
jgi:hypothetical protein